MVGLGSGGRTPVESTGLPKPEMSLNRMCRKLRDGDVVKFYREITHEDEEE